MGLTRTSDGWRFEIITKHIEPYLEIALSQDWGIHHVSGVLDWDSIREFKSSLRQIFYSRAIAMDFFPSKEQLVTCLRKEGKKCLNKLICFILDRAVNEPERYPADVKWLNLFRSAFKDLTPKEQLRIWGMFSYKKMLLAHIMPLSFFSLVMNEESREHCDWKGIFEKRLLSESR